MYTRTKRTKQYRNYINDTWYKKYFKWIQDNPEKPWSWEGISMNKNITMKIVLDNPDKPWNWDWISMNENITWEIILTYPDKPWDWYGISNNPNITMEFIEKHSDKINFAYLSTNKFTVEDIGIKKKEALLLLEKDRSFHKLQNLYIIGQYL